MLTLDHRPFQRQIHALLDDTRGRLTDLPALRRAIEDGIRQHRIPLDPVVFLGRCGLALIGKLS